MRRDLLAASLIGLLFAACAGCGAPPAAPADDGVHVNPDWPPKDPATEGPGTAPPPVTAGVEVSFVFAEDPVPLDRPAHVQFTLINRSPSAVWFSAAPPYINVLHDRNLIYLDFNSIKDQAGTLHFPSSNVQLEGAGPTLAVKEVPPGARVQGLYEVDLRPFAMAPGDWDAYALAGYATDTTIVTDPGADRLALWNERAKTQDYSWLVAVK